MKKNIRNAILLAALIAFALWFTLKDDYKDVIHNVQMVPVYAIIFVFILGITYYVIQGYLLATYAKKFKKDTKIIDGIENAYIAAFFNGVTPLGGGQIMQSYAFSKIGISMSNIASILWTDFFFFQICAISTAVTLIITNFQFTIDTLNGSFILVLIGIAINSFVIIALWMMSKFPKLFIKITHMIINLLYKIKIVKNKQETLDNWTENLNRFSSDVSNIKSNKDFIRKGLFWNYIRLIIFYLIPYFIALSLGLKFTPIQIVHVVAASSFIHMLNALTPLPGDTGFTEAVFILIFTTVFVDDTTAKAVMIIWRAATYYLNILIGGGFFLYFKTKKYKGSTPITEEK